MGNTRPILISILMLMMFLFAENYSSAQTRNRSYVRASGGSFSPTKRRELNAGLKILRNPQEPLALPATQKESTSADICKEQTDLDLSGTYDGVYFLDKRNKRGVPAKLKITGNTFELTSDSLNGTGLISAVNSCGETSISLKFTRATGYSELPLTDLLTTAISLDARAAGQGGRGENIDSLQTDRAIILATARDRSGKLAGADIAYVICPPHPKCKRYPSCPCPDPTKEQP
jgi:hypothetical protein